MSPDHPELRKFLPALSLLLLLIGLTYTLLNPQGPLGDPGTGWQLKTGQWLWEHKTLPTHDLFSYTVPDQPWILYQWLFQVMAGALQQVGGIALVMVVCSFLYNLIPLIVVQRMLAQRSHFLLAMVLAFCTWMVMTMHDLTRPHVFTYLFFSIFLLILERVYNNVESWRKNIPILCGLPLLMLFWCNLHGGFFVGFILCGIFSIAALLDFWQSRRQEKMQQAALFAAVLVVCLLVSLINPYGWDLHRNILSYLNLESLKLWTEFMPPFTSPSLNVYLFEASVLLLIVLMAFGRKRLTWAELGCVIVFLHLALHSVRHVNLFVLVVAPILARLGTEYLQQIQPNFSKRMIQIGQEQLQGKTHRYYVPLLAVLWISLVWLAPTKLPHDLPDIRLSKAAGDYIAQHPEKFSRMFNTDNLGGALVYRFSPNIKIFMDDRTDYYRDDFILKTYLPILQLKEGWMQKLESFGVSSAVLPAKTSLGAALAQAGWERVFHDEKIDIYLKNP